jgi:hypothetical protein
MLIGFAAGALVTLPILPVVAMPLAATAPLITSHTNNDVTFVVARLGGCVLPQHEARPRATELVVL